MLRHLDCAWEIRADKQVIGFFIVEAENPNGKVLSSWYRFIADTISPAIVAASLPHRGPEGQLGIASCFIRVTTWQRVCKEFKIDWASLPDKVTHTSSEI